MIAQELQEVISEVVADTEWTTNEETGEQSEVEAERLGVYYSDLIPVLIKAIQDQQEIIETNRQEIENLKTYELEASDRITQLEKTLFLDKAITLVN